MDKIPHGCIKESGSQMKADPQESSDCAKTTLSDVSKLTTSFGEIQNNRP
jgi:hypothetical protein